MNERILIVDDVAEEREAIKNILQPEGYKIVGEADDGDVGIKMMKQLKPDLVTMDLVMPRVDGIKAMREMIKINPHIKVIMITRIDQRDSLMLALKIGAVDYIVKPFENDKILGAVKKALENAK